MSPVALLPAVADVAADAARWALEQQRRAFRRWEKAPGDPVSEIDLALDHRLRDALGALAREAAWLSEESVDDRARLRAERVWVVDPLDGTRDYLRGRSGWAVSVALVEAGVPVLGVLAAPGRDELWTAAAGAGAALNGSAIRVEPRHELAGARVPADSLPRADRDLQAIAKPNGIALRMALVADGRAHLTMASKLGSEWDLAAAALIAAEAGAVVTDAAGTPLRFNKPDPRAPGVLVAVPGIHAAAVERLRDRVGRQ